MNADRKRDPDATRNAILSAAESVFLERGFGEASLSRIAKEAGVTKSLIHHHFGSKEELWAAIKLRRLSPYFDMQEKVLKESDATPKLIQHSMGMYFNYLKDIPEVVRMLAWSYLEGDDCCKEAGDRCFELGVAKIREAQEKGRFRNDLPAEFILITFLSLIEHWFLMKPHLLQDHPELNHPQLDPSFLDNITKIFFEGILPRDS